MNAVTVNGQTTLCSFAEAVSRLGQYQRLVIGSYWLQWDAVDGRYYAYDV